MDTLFDLSSFIIQTINFVIVALVLRAFIFKPYMKYLEEEAQKRKDLEEKLATSEALLLSAKEEAEKIIDKARLDAKMIGNEIVENARKESLEITNRAQIDADAIRAKGFAQVEQERKTMTEELKSKVLDIAIRLNAKLFEKSDSHTDFLKKNASNIEF